MYNQFKANLKEIFHEFINRRMSSWFGLIISPLFMIGIVTIASQNLLFTTFIQAEEGIFAIALADVWVGLFNSITMICSIRPKIKVQYIQGMSIGSFIFANVVFQFFKCMIQSLIATAVFMSLGYGVCVDFPTSGIQYPLWAELYMIVFSTMFSADMLGMAISSFAADTVSAMTIMPSFLYLK